MKNTSKIYAQTIFSYGFDILCCRAKINENSVTHENGHEASSATDQEPLFFHTVIAEGANCPGWWEGRWVLINRVLRFHSFSDILTSEMC